MAYAMTAIWTYGDAILTSDTPIDDPLAGTLSADKGTTNRYSLKTGVYRTGYSATIAITSGEVQLQHTTKKTTPWPDPPHATEIMAAVPIDQRTVDAFLAGGGAQVRLKTPDPVHK